MFDYLPPFVTAGLDDEAEAALRAAWREADEADRAEVLRFFDPAAWSGL